jgi:hypothetical protein
LKGKAVTFIKLQEQTVTSDGGESPKEVKVFKLVLIRAKRFYSLSG